MQYVGNIRPTENSLERGVEFSLLLHIRKITLDTTRDNIFLE